LCPITIGVLFRKIVKELKTQDNNPNSNLNNSKSDFYNLDYDINNPNSYINNQNSGILSGNELKAVAFYRSSLCLLRTVNDCLKPVCMAFFKN
jgi:hypothetical protein